MISCETRRKEIVNRTRWVLRTRLPPTVSKFVAAIKFEMEKMDNLAFAVFRMARRSMRGLCIESTTRVRVHNQYITSAASVMAGRKTLGQR